MTPAEAVALLKITPPTTLNVLVRAYRYQSRLEHPDVSKHPDANRRFARLTEAYEFAKTCAEILDQCSVDAKTDDGTLLSDLGGGLGPRTNGRPCDECAGKGFLSHRQVKHVTCHYCRREDRPLTWAHFASEGRWSYRCQRCNGSGIFAKNGGRCFPCNGSGWIAGKRLGNSCRRCFGTTRIPQDTSLVVYTRCITCKGCGELLVFNPVIPKGLLR